MLTIPLIVLAQVVLQNFASEAVVAAPSPEPTALGSLNIWSKLAISIGAGLYEELLFRMLLIAVLHTLLVDVAKLNSALGSTIAIVVSAGAFTLYHPAAGLGPAVFYFLAGLYFGVVYLLRGFGIVVGVHAIYDIIMVSMLPQDIG